MSTTDHSVSSPTGTNPSNLPEVNHAATPQTHSSVFGQQPYEDFEYYQPQTGAIPEHVPNYQPYASPALSSRSPPLSTERATSPPVTDPITGTKDRPLSPSTGRWSEVGSPGLQSVYNEGEKEVAHNAYPVGALPAYKSEYYPPQQNPQYVAPEHQQQQQQQQQEPRRRRVCGLPMKLCLLLAALLLVAILALAIGLGVGLTRHHNSPATPTNSTNSSASAPAPTGNPLYNIGGALNPNYFSLSGAFNGSGIAIASENFGIDSSIFVYYQHYTGEIRYSSRAASGTWTSGNEGDIVTSNAKNGTPLSAVAYVVSAVATWHVFYLTPEGYVNQRTRTNVTNTWNDGPLNAHALAALDADQVGLQACYWGNFYGDADYTFAGGIKPSNTSTAPATGMHLWYASDNTTFQQLSWYNGANAWQIDNQTWPNMNGHAGIGCYTWISWSDLSYVTMIDQHDTLTIWWKDSNASAISTAEHPINQWVNTSIAIPNVQASSSMGYTDFLSFQAADNSMRGYNISWLAENTTFVINPDATTNSWDGTKYQGYIVTDQATGQPAYGIPGTHSSITALMTTTGGSIVTLLYQQSMNGTGGNTIQEWSRDAFGGPWTENNMFIAT